VPNDAGSRTWPGDTISPRAHLVAPTRGLPPLDLPMARRTRILEEPPVRHSAGRAAFLAAPAAVAEMPAPAALTDAWAAEAPENTAWAPHTEAPDANEDAADSLAPAPGLPEAVRKQLAAHIMAAAEANGTPAVGPSPFAPGARPGGPVLPAIAPLPGLGQSAHPADVAETDSEATTADASPQRRPSSPARPLPPLTETFAPGTDAQAAAAATVRQSSGAPHAVELETSTGEPARRRPPALEAAAETAPLQTGHTDVLPQPAAGGEAKAPAAPAATGRAAGRAPVPDVTAAAPIVPAAARPERPAPAPAPEGDASTDRMPAPAASAPAIAPATAPATAPAATTLQAAQPAVPVPAPAPAPATVVSAAPAGVVQRTPDPEQERRTADAPKETPAKPLSVTHRLPDAVVQRAIARAPSLAAVTPVRAELVQRDVTPEVSPAPEPAPTVTYDLDALARQVYPLIKRMLQIERERGRSPR
jgi:hypothetical protein